jgi:hypothetical protein
VRGCCRGTLLMTLQFGERRTSHFLPAAPLNEAACRLILRIGLRKHAPPDARVEDPQHRVEHLVPRNRLAAVTIVGNVLLWNVPADQLAPLVARLDRTTFAFDGPATRF